MAGRWKCKFLYSAEIGINENTYNIDGEGFLSPSPTPEDGESLAQLSGYVFVPDPPPPPQKPKKAVATAKKSIFKKKK